jgi:predicted CopG family antitoxin
MIKLLDLVKEILDGANQAPYGLMFFGDNKVLVGDNHNNPIEFSKDLQDKIVSIGKTHGYYGEGSGISNNPAVKNSEVYKELVNVKAADKKSWDDLIKSSNKSDFLYALFANVKENHRLEKLLKAKQKGDTIYDVIQRTRNDWAATKGTSNSDLDNFLKDASGNYDFTQMSKSEATVANLKDFLRKGEKDMWPSNWKDYPNPSGKVARKATTLRDEWLIKAGPGVYFVGEGHLKDIANMKGSGKKIGG